MALFNFGSEMEHRVYHHKPIYYDEEKEELRKKFGAVDGSAEKDKAEGKYVPGSYLRGTFTDGNYQRLSKKSKLSKISAMISIVSLVLMFVILYFIAKFYTLL